MCMKPIYTCFKILESMVFTTGKNVALWKSTYIEGRLGFTSDKAVDGNGDGNFIRGQTCTHTAVNQTHSPTWN